MNLVCKKITSVPLKVKKINQKYEFKKKTFYTYSCQGSHQANKAFLMAYDRMNR